MATTVTLNVYDISGGMAQQMSRALIGRQIDGIWHTGIVVYGTEFFFGGGICEMPPKSTPYGQPVKELPMGTTEIPEDVFRDFLNSIASEYTIEKYDLFKHNCNHFTNEACMFLVGKGIPEDIVNLAQEVLNTPLGTMKRRINLPRRTDAGADDAVVHGEHPGADHAPGSDCGPCCCRVQGSG